MFRMEKINGVIGIVFQKGNPDKFALIHNKKSGNITFPAGGREENEDIGDALKREIKEETGLNSEDYKIIKTPVIHEFVYNSRKKERVGQKARQQVYLLETLKKDLKPEDPNIKIYGWYIAEEVLEKLNFKDSKELFKKAIVYI